MKTLTKQKISTAGKKTSQPLPESWKKAAGLLKGRKTPDPLAYQRSVRQEWETRMKKLEKLAVKLRKTKTKNGR